MMASMFEPNNNVRKSTKAEKKRVLCFISLNAIIVVLLFSTPFCMFSSLLNFSILSRSPSFGNINKLAMRDIRPESQQYSFVNTWPFFGLHMELFIEFFPTRQGEREKEEAF